MAVHARIIGILPVRDGSFLEVFNAPFADFHLMPDLVSRFDQAIGQIGIYLILGNIDFPLQGFLLASFKSDFRRKRYGISLRICQHILPLPQIPDNLLTLKSMDCILTADDSTGLPDTIRSIMKIKGSDIDRYCHAHIIRIYRQCGVGGDLLTFPPAGGTDKQQEDCCYYLI